jgi:hypothetical protein
VERTIGHSFRVHVEIFPATRRVAAKARHRCVAINYVEALVADPSLFSWHTQLIVPLYESLGFRYYLCHPASRSSRRFTALKTAYGF